MYNIVLVSGIKQSNSVIHIYIYTHILFQIPFPYWLLQNIECSSLCYRLGPYWLSMLYIAYQCFYILGISLSLIILLQMFFHNLLHAALFIE